MLLTKIEKKQLEGFTKFWGKYLQKIPEMKKAAVEAAGKVLQQEVQKQVDEQGIQDPQGRVKSWQELHVGSKGGYAAVRPVKDPTDATWGGSTVKANKFTLWLDYGHALRTPSGTDPNYDPELKKAVMGAKGPVVKGRMFYSWGKSYGFKKAIEAANLALDGFDLDAWEDD